MSKYVDFAEYYDFDHAITEDVPFYLQLARHYGSPVLELACGTGRVLIPLARAGFELHGIDISANMLDVCRRAVERFSLQTSVGHPYPYTCPASLDAPLCVVLRSNVEQLL